MTFLRQSTGAVFVLLALLGWTAPIHGQETQKPFPDSTIRVNVDRVRVGVAVTGARGRFVSGLRREDFHIYDNGVEQTLTGFVPDDDPAQVVILLEGGPAALYLGNEEMRSSTSLLDSISPSDRVAVVNYSDHARLMLDFTTDRTAVRSMLRRLVGKAAVGAREVDLPESIGETLDWLAGVEGKKTIVLLSSGVTTSSADEWLGLRRKLGASDVRVLGVSPASDFRKFPKWRKLSPQEKEDRTFIKQVFAEADQTLREISRESGGRVYFPKDAKGLERVFAEIGNLVRHEYGLEFEPQVKDGELHKLKVKVKKAFSRVDYREAYLAPGQTAQ